MTDKDYLIDPKKRFSSRVENYIKFRPRYPPEIIEFLKEKKILTRKSIVADIGSGTGILSEIFLKNGNRVFGIEPNNNMRVAGEDQLKKYPLFISIDGSAESTGLKDKSIDVITVGQAFHWFNVLKAKKEFKRILKPNGFVVIIWNNRRKMGGGFSSQYEKFILKFGTDVKQVRKNENKIDGFYNYQRKVFYNYQDLDFTGLKGRLLSVSYIPLEGHPNYEKMLKELQTLFNSNKLAGKVRIEYDTEVYYGQLSALKI
ncbi:MAG: class I SAM-dependent methyltransferase [Promethearchaeota archaeon]|jgi:SAM-dependent methyltransferase